ncbi:uncharacterized protein EDB91DRAFT_1253010 [Suillus paluster]|uniref:uncharacterized protein n=1 Tax=Suillus paluster TaxID=48578 RepID=UPI001B87C03F|nr:uncharacterized protein EDB91DRAFT_1253010 [Suillus paluster]KAG1729496.1 hypothetical protein EDB91DRAFT_1253010 [Suillus paluster]
MSSHSTHQTAPGAPPSCSLIQYVAPKSSPPNRELLEISTHLLVHMGGAGPFTDQNTPDARLAPLDPQLPLPSPHAASAQPNPASTLYPSLHSTPPPHYTGTGGSSINNPDGSLPQTLGSLPQTLSSHSQAHMLLALSLIYPPSLHWCWGQSDLASTLYPPSSLHWHSGQSDH